MKRVCISPLASLMLVLLLSLSSCYTYKVATHAQPGGDELATTTIHAQSLFWGLINKPQVIQTGPCDALDLPGVAEVKVETSFGNVLLTFATLGIYCPMRIVYKCSKPCAQSGEL
ncbi:MAG: hypothetical protein JST06_08300 [Bacteroidetes bacterium]|nr:hypothetical protein [Bacteroidota bacterium]